MINAERAYYIKLGRGGEYERACLTPPGSLRIDYCEIPADRVGDAHAIYLDLGRRPGVATRFANELQSFYDADESVLWITFHGDKLYWCFASRSVTPLPDGGRQRLALEPGWQCTDRHGAPLLISHLRGNLTTTRGARNAICAIGAEVLQYLLARINGETPSDVVKADVTREAYQQAVSDFVRRLSWQDFELLIDLLFRAAGWRRRGVLGKTEKSIDLELESPLTEERIAVQVKSTASLDDVRQFCAYLDLSSFSRSYFIFHTPEATAFYGIERPSGLTLWGLEDVTRKVCAYGLGDWVIDRYR